MKIQVVGKLNGLGLSHDVDVLRMALEPKHAVDFTDWKSPRRSPRHTYDANIFTELINPAFFGQARMNYGLLNPEWTQSTFVSQLSNLDAILCKTRDAESIFGNYGYTEFIGFTSRDMLDKSTHRERKFLHVAGGSSAKGTAETIEVFRRTGFPLTIIGDTHVPHELPPNIKRMGRVDTQTLKQAMNSHLSHVCASSYEGFGHYLNEARSVAAVIITTNAAPMNEIATADFAFGASYDSITVQNLAQHKHVNIDGLEAMLRLVNDLPDEVADELGKSARQAYLDGMVHYVERMREIFP